MNGQEDLFLITSLIRKIQLIFKVKLKKKKTLHTSGKYAYCAIAFPNLQSWQVGRYDTKKKKKIPFYSIPSPSQAGVQNVAVLLWEYGACGHDFTRMH